MELNKYVVAVFGGDFTAPNLYLAEQEAEIRNDFIEEYPDISFVPASEFLKTNRVEMAACIMRLIEGELENANRHSINGCQDHIFEHLVKNGVDEFIAAEAIYEGFEELF